MNELILIPIVSFWFTNVTGIPQAFRRAFQLRGLKPFDCVKCLSFWMMLAYQIYIGFTPYSFIWCALSSLAGYLIYVLFKKLNIPIND
jgi:hypothetical protein